MPYIPQASVNHMYGLTVTRGKPKKFLKPEARNWKQALADKVAAWKRQHGVSVHPGSLVRVNLTTRFPKRGGRGKGHKADACNFLKLPIDAIAKGLGVDDCTFEGGWQIGAECENPYLIYQVEIL